MPKKVPSKLTQARRLVEEQMDWLIQEINRRDEMYRGKTQQRLASISCFGGDLYALNVLYTAIIHAQRIGAKEASPGLRKALMEALHIPMMHIDAYAGTCSRLHDVLPMWLDRRKFIELIS